MTRLILNVPHSLKCPTGSSGNIIFRQIFETLNNGTQLHASSTERGNENKYFLRGLYNLLYKFELWFTHLVLWNIHIKKCFKSLAVVVQWTVSDYKRNGRGFCMVRIDPHSEKYIIFLSSRWLYKAQFWYPQLNM